MARLAHPFTIVKETNDTKRLGKDERKRREKGEPKLLINDMTCPPTLQGEARKEWDKLVNLYHNLDSVLLNDLDANVLEAYCNAVAKYREAIQMSRGQEVIRILGEPKINPWVKVSLDAEDTMRKLGGLLLLDPVSRARVGLARSKDEELSPMARMLRGED